MPKNTEDLSSDFFEISRANGKKLFVSPSDAQKVALDYIDQGDFNEDITEFALRNFKTVSSTTLGIELEDPRAPVYFDINGRGHDAKGRFTSSAYSSVKTGKTSHRIGCKFNGVYEIMEYEDDKIYVPSSYYCGIKCYEKYSGKTSNRWGMKPYGSTMTALRSYAYKKFGFTKDTIPMFVKTFNDGKIKTAHKDAMNDVGMCIYLAKVEDEYHAVLCKTNNVSEIDVDHIYKNMKPGRIYDLSEDAYLLRKTIEGKKSESVIVWDLETSSDLVEGKRKQCPEGVGYFNLSFSSFNPDEMKRNNVTVKHGDSCIEKMITDICENVDGDKHLFVSHNGGKFDTIYVKAISNPSFKIVSEYGSIGRIKKLTCKFMGKTLIFIDSNCFLLASLENSCKYFDIGASKYSLDISGKTKEWFKTKRNLWVPYLQQDVLVLSLLVHKLELMLNTMHQSMTNTTGIPSISWNILMNTCHGLSKVFIAKDPVTSQFMKDSCYGGRNIHWRREFIAGKTLIRGKTSEGLVALDGNSLFPAAMCFGEFPIGIQRIIPGNELNKLETKYVGQYLYIVEVTVDANNARYPLLPYKDEKGCITYRSDEFTGVYTSVDLEEALNDGYIIKKVHRGIYWADRKIIFDETIKHMYNKRIALKNKNNPMQYLIKSIMCSAYGKFLECPKSMSSFSDDGNKRYVNSKVCGLSKLKNGQTQYSLMTKHPVYRKPTHIAAFILSNARKIMNNHIRKIGPENIFYGDTDSLYTTVEAARKIKLTDELGGLKNDYGKDILIKRALFLDTKRYYIKFNKSINGNIFKCSFNGLNFKDDRCMNNWIEGDETKGDGILKMMRWLHANPGIQMKIGVIQDKWKKHGDYVDIDVAALKFQVNPAHRATWQKGRNYSFPLGYDFDMKQALLGKITTFDKKAIRLHYSLSRYGFRSALPLQSKNIKSFMLVTSDFNLKTRFIKDEGGKCYSMEKDRNGDEKFRRVDGFGVTDEIWHVEDQRSLLVVPYNPNCNYPLLTLEEELVLRKRIGNIYTSSKRHKDTTM